MSSGKDFGVSDENTLGKSAGRLGEESEILGSQIDTLIQDMEGIHKSLVGGSGSTFGSAASEVGTRLSELAGWCSQQGIKLGDNQSSLNESESFAQEVFGEARSALGGLSRGVNG